MSYQSAYIPLERSRSLAAYGMDLMVNVGVTTAIAGRLWYRGRCNPNLVACSEPTQLRVTNRYMGPIFVMLESGVIAAAMQLTDMVILVWSPTLIIATFWFSAQLSVSYI